MNQARNERAGRCKPCGAVFFWKAGKGRPVRLAWCPWCGRKLQQTVAALLINARPVRGVEPRFGRFPPQGARP